MTAQRDRLNEIIKAKQTRTFSDTINQESTLFSPPGYKDLPDQWKNKKSNELMLNSA